MQWLEVAPQIGPASCSGMSSRSLSDRPRARAPFCILRDSGNQTVSFGFAAASVYASMGGIHG